MGRSEKMENVRCNECDYVGSLSLYWAEEHVTSTRDNGNITAIYIECPNCGDRHFSYLKDDVTERTERQLKDLHESIVSLLYDGVPTEFEKARGDQLREEFSEVQAGLVDHRRKLHEDYAPTEGEE